MIKSARLCFGIIAAAAVLVFAFSFSFAHGNHNKSESNANANAASAVEQSKAEPAPTPSQAAASADKVSANHRIEEFATLHPLVVHFPIVLLIFAAIFQLTSFFIFKDEFGIAALVLAITGTLGAYLASNVFHPHTSGLSPSAEYLLARHEFYADLTFWFGLAAIAAKLISLRLTKYRTFTQWLATVLLFAAATAVAVAGHHGAELVHKEGVGPQGRFLEQHDH